MSKVVDERVVQMQFDNRNFEKNVSQSMSTLDKLKEKLKFTGATKGLQDISNEAGKVNLSPIGKAVESIEVKFSNLQIAAYTAMYRMTNYAITAGKNMVKTLSTDNIIAGWNKLQQKANSMSTLISQGYDTETVEKQLERLLWFSDETSYNFTDMIDNISKFTATGKKLEPSVNAMQGIAVWAAKSGQNAQKASMAMYQLSQALGAGYMRKEDWKSIQNYSMDTDEFRQAALDTAVSLKKLKKVGKDTYQSLQGDKKKFTKSQFAESLTKGEWFTADVMMKVYAKYSKGAEQTKALIDTMDEKFDKDFIATDIIKAYDAYHKSKEDFQKYLTKNNLTGEAAKEFEKLIKGLDKFGMSALKAGQEYRTFQDVIDATKDAVSTKWMSIFETILGNIDQQKELWTTVGEKFYEWFAEPLNTLLDGLKEWASKGGRNNLFESFSNIGEAISSIVQPIKDAWNAIFHPDPEGEKSLAEKLIDLTKKFKEFTASLKISEETAGYIKDIFQSVFSVLKFGIDVIKTVIKAAIKIVAAFKGIAKGLIGIFSLVGKVIHAIMDVINKSGIITNTLNIIATTIEKALTLLGDFITNWLKFDKVISLFYKLTNIIKKVAQAIAEVVKSIINDGTAKQGAELFNTGIIGYILLNGAKLIKWLKNFTSNFTDTLNKTTKLFEQLGGILNSWQKNLDAKTLLKIAEAVLILVVALKVLSGIDPARLGSSLSAMAVAMLELMGAFKLFTIIMKKSKGSIKNTFGIIGMALALLIASKAIKDLASLSWEGIGKGLTAMFGAMTILIATTRLMGSTKSSFLGISKEKKSLLSMAISLVIIAKAMQMLAKLTWDDVARALLAMFGAFTILIKVTKQMSNAKFKKAAVGRSLVMITSIMLLAKGMQMLAKLTWDDVARSLVAMAGAMTILSLVVTHMGNTSKSTATKKERKNLIAMTASLITLAKGMQMLAVLTWDDIGRALVAMLGSLTLLTICIALFAKVKKKDNMALIAATASLIILGKGLKTLAGLSWGDVAKSLVTAAGAFIILAVAAKALKKAGGILLKVGAAMLLIGIASAIIGTGLLLIASGITALAGAMLGSLSIVIGGITAIIMAILNLVPEIALAIGRLILALCKVIKEGAPEIAETIMVVIFEVIKSLAEYLPSIVEELLKGIIDVLRMIATHLPELIVAAVEVVQAFFKGFVQALKILDKDVLIEGIKAVGMITVILLLMATLAALAPAALIGILAFGVLVTELAIVLKTIGKILGGMDLSNIVKAGNILEQVGLAIGKFIGGIIGGIGHAIASVLPDIGANLSDFATNIVPFLDTVRSKVDATILKNVGILSASLLLITEAGFISKVLSFLSGKNGLSELGKELSDFMDNVDGFIEGLYDIHPSVLKNVKSLSEAIKVICAASLISRLSSFGSWLLGDSSITRFGKDLVKMAEYLNDFIKKLGTFGDSETSTVEAASNAIKKLADVSKDIPRTGGVWSWLAGDNSIAKFGSQLPGVGTNLKDFVSNLGEFSTAQVETVKAAGEAVKELAEASSQIPNTGGLWSWIAGDNSLGDFASYLPSVGENLNKFVTNLGTFSDAQVNIVKASGAAVRELAEASSKIPKSGGVWGWISGDNSLGAFSKFLPDVGENLGKFVANINKSGGFTESSPETIKLVGECLNVLAEAANKLPKNTKISAFWGMFEYSSSTQDIGQFSNSLESLGENIKTMAEGFKDIDKKDLEKVKVGAECIVSLADAASRMPTKTDVSLIWGLFSITSGGSTGDLKSFAENFPTIAEGIGGFVSKLNEYKFKQGDVKTAESGANVIKLLAQAAQAIPSSGGWFEKITGKQDMNAFVTDFPKFAEGIGGFVSKLNEYKFKESDVKMAESGAKVIQVLAEASSKIDHTGGITSLWSGDQDLEDFATGFPKVGEGIAGFIKEVNGLDENQITSVNAALKVVETFAALDGKDLDDLTDNLDDLKTGMIGLTSIISLFVSHMSKIKQEDLDSSISKVKDLVELCKTSIDVDPEKLKTFGDSLSKIGKNAINGFKDSMSDENASKTASEGVRALIDKIQTSIDAKQNDVKDKFRSLITNALATLQDKKVYTDATLAGEDLAKGFADGINNKKYLSEEAGKRLGKSALEAARKELDEHSPSKKARKIGSFFGEGFVNGISDYTKTAYSESYNMATEATNGLSSAIARISDLIDGNIDSQPTIRPILDLSDIQNQAGKINNMFDSVSVGANLNAISKGMTGRNQNGNADVVSAIDKLGQGLGNGGNTYNFNGISYSDNKEISDAIEVLLRAANVERRI